MLFRVCSALCLWKNMSRNPLHPSSFVHSSQMCECPSLSTDEVLLIDRDELIEAPRCVCALVYVCVASFWYLWWALLWNRLRGLHLHYSVWNMSFYPPSPPSSPHTQVVKLAPSFCVQTLPSQKDLPISPSVELCSFDPSFFIGFQKNYFTSHFCHIPPFVFNPLNPVVFSVPWA